MATDPFAAIRKRDTGVSTSFALRQEHQEHVGHDGVFLGNAQKTLLAHQEHQEHRFSEEDWRYGDMPVDWATGLRQLGSRAVPDGATPDRWQQVVQDALNFAIGWADVAVEHNWSIGAVFGFDHRRPFDENSGLVVQIRGRRVIAMMRDARGREFADIKDGPRFYQRPALDVRPPLWAAEKAQ